MTIPSFAITLLGWLGAAASIAAYYLVSSKRFAPDSLRYHSLNVTSCVLLATACASTGAWPSFLTNTIFIAVGAHMIWRVRGRLKSRALRIARACSPRRALRALRPAGSQSGAPCPRTRRVRPTRAAAEERRAPRRFPSNGCSSNRQDSVSERSLNTREGSVD